MYSNETYLLEQLQESGLLTERDIQQAKNGLKPGESSIEVLIKTGTISDEQIAQMVGQVLARFGRLDCAFNNAGLSLPPKSFLDHSLEDWREVLEVDLTSVFLCMQHQIRAMLATGGGSIVNNGSGASLMGAQGMPHYTAAKHGLIGLMKVAAKEFADSGIRVNTICPGVIDTVPMRAFVDAIGPAGESFLQTLPGGRMGEPAEVGRVVAWLCSDEAAYISGATISVDGGMLCL